MAHDPITWRCKWRVEKRRVDEPTPYEVIEDEGNLLMYGGASALWQRLIGTAVAAFDSTNTHIGVGDGTTAAAPTQTDLQGTNKHREPLDTGFPNHTDGTAVGNSSIVYKATFEDTDANFAWEEWGLFNALSAGRMLNRKVSPLGVKTSDDEWSLTITITLA